MVIQCECRPKANHLVLIPSVLLFNESEDDIQHVQWYSKVCFHVLALVEYIWNLKKRIFLNWNNSIKKSNGLYCMRFVRRRLQMTNLLEWFLPGFVVFVFYLFFFSFLLLFFFSFFLFLFLCPPSSTPSFFLLPFFKYFKICSYYTLLLMWCDYYFIRSVMAEVLSSHIH